MPKGVHQRGSFSRTVSTIGVTLFTSVLSFTKRGGSSPALASSTDSLVGDQKRVSWNFVGELLPPANWMVCHPSTSVLPPSGISVSESTEQSNTCKGQNKKAEYLLSTSPSLIGLFRGNSPWTVKSSTSCILIASDQRVDDLVSTDTTVIRASCAS